jgi:hypothetical protein
MTFTEAAIEVLRREGKPLHFRKLAEIAIRENLLDHVGKVPEETMAGQLAAHCRLPHVERRLLPVQPGTFALVEWNLEEDPAGLDGLVEPPPEDEPSYRGRERHPVPSRELSRGGGARSEGRPRRREEEERRGRRFPPPAEVAYEILAGAGKPLTVVEIAATGAERLLMPDAFVRDAGALRAALGEDNRRREGAGRKPLFQLDGDTVTLVAQPEPGERAPAAPAAARAASGAGELRRAALAALRRRLRECDGPTVEHVVMRVLEKQGMRELKVAKRGREHVVCTGKRRMGLGEVRHAVRIVRSGADAGRRDVTDLRRDLGHYGAQIGVLVSAGDVGRDARGEAGAAGQLPILLLCGEALAEAFADAGVGCVPVVVPEVDDVFFRTAAELAEREEAARRARREERDRREGRTRDEVAVGAEGSAEATEPSAGEDAGAAEPPATREITIGEEAPRHADVGEVAEAAEGDQGEPDEDEEEGPEGEEAAPAEAAPAEGAPGEPGAAGAGERRRRRRRRRRRGGRGRGQREGAAAPGEGGASAAAPGEGAPSQGASAQASAPPPAPAAPEPPPPPREPSGGEGG